MKRNSVHKPFTIRSEKICIRSNGLGHLFKKYCHLFEWVGSTVQTKFASVRTAWLIRSKKMSIRSNGLAHPFRIIFVSTGMNFAKIWLSMCANDCVRFARYCSKMYSCHLFLYGGLHVAINIIS